MNRPLEFLTHRSVRAIDSHTEGEPTRVLIAGVPRLRGSSMAERRDELQREWDALRTTAIAGAPEGTVVAFLTEATSANADAGVIFADRAAYLHMCGHGSIGVARTLVHVGRRFKDNRFTFDTPAGIIHGQLFEDGSVEIQNVPSHVFRLDVSMDVPEVGKVTGDIAYGGNWFFIVNAATQNIPIESQNIPQLTRLTQRIADALGTQSITGENDAEIEHVAIFGPPQRLDADSKNFVRCPDGAYDRSPCGTGTSAKLALLAARGELRPDQSWRQESITGSLFACRFDRLPGRDNAVVPFIRGHAYITGELNVL